MTLPAARKYCTVAEYLDLEAAAETKHEYHAGEILAMSGGTYRHSRIIANLIRAVGTRLEGSPCFILESNMRVRLASDDRYVYPDASVVCGEPQFDPQDPDQTSIINPRVIVEVLSDSTEAYDRGAKFTAYRDLRSMEEYVLVSQDRPQAETYVRQGDGTWLFAAFRGTNSAATLRTLTIDLPLAAIYAGISFPAGPAAEASNASSPPG